MAAERLLTKKSPLYFENSVVQKVRTLGLSPVVLECNDTCCSSMPVYSLVVDRFPKPLRSGVLHCPTAIERK